MESFRAHLANEEEKTERNASSQFYKTYEISCSQEAISVHTSLAPSCKIPYLRLTSLSLIKATEFSIFL